MGRCRHIIVNRPCPSCGADMEVARFFTGAGDTVTWYGVVCMKCEFSAPLLSLIPDPSDVQQTMRANGMEPSECILDTVDELWTCDARLDENCELQMFSESMDGNPPVNDNRQIPDSGAGYKEDCRCGRL